MVQPATAQKAPIRTGRCPGASHLLQITPDANPFRAPGMCELGRSGRMRAALMSMTPQGVLSIRDELSERRWRGTGVVSISLNGKRAAEFPCIGWNLSVVNAATSGRPSADSDTPFERRCKGSIGLGAMLVCWEDEIQLDDYQSRSSPRAAKPETSVLQTRCCALHPLMML